MGQALRKTEAATQTLDAVAMLVADHRYMELLFEQYQHARSSQRKQQLVHDICRELSAHLQIEEEVFFPALQQALDSQPNRALIIEAEVEHDSFRHLMTQIADRPAEGEVFDAQVKVLAEYVEHHVNEEQRDIFPKARMAGLDLKALGQRMAQRKAELLAAS